MSLRVAPSSKTPSKNNTLPRQLSVPITSPSAPKPKVAAKSPALKLPSTTNTVPGLKKPAQSSPRAPVPPSTPATITTPIKAKNSALPPGGSIKRPAPTLLRPSVSSFISPTTSSGQLASGLDASIEDTSKQYKDIDLVQIFKFLEKHAFGFDANTEQDTQINERMYEAFKDVDTGNSSWPKIIENFRKKLAKEPRELYAKQSQKMQDQLQSQVFVMNERLVDQQENNEELSSEVVTLRRQMQSMEDEVRSISMLRRSLHINIQAAMDHLVVSQKLLSDDKLEEAEEDNPIYKTPVISKPNFYEREEPNAPSESTDADHYHDQDQDHGEGTAFSEGDDVPGGQEGGHYDERDETEREREYHDDDGEFSDFMTEAEAQDLLAKIPVGDGSNDAGFEFFV